MRRLRPASLAQRLTLLFVTIGSTVLMGMGWLVSTSVERHFEALDLDVLAGKMELVAHALQNVSTPDDLTQLAHQLARSLVGHRGLEVMLLDADGAVIFATAQANFDPAIVSTDARLHPDQPRLWTVAGESYRGLARRIPTSTRNALGQAESYDVAAAIDIGHHQAYMRSFLRTLWLYVAAAALLMAALGWWSVRRGLAPLRAIGQHAQVVTAQQLGQRVSAQRMPVELAELAQSLNDMLARLEEAFKRLSDFSSDIAHELRTPVSNLMTQTQVALSLPRSADNYRDVLESNAEELERMARMIADMLLLAKADNGLVVPNRELIDLTSEVQALFDYYEAVADERNLTLQSQGSANVEADRLMLRRAIGNLLSNAIRHATPGTAIQVTLHHGAGDVSLRVRNSGDTIAPELLERIFDRFFRADPARQRGPEGAGLGLAITRSIVLAHGGRISATSSDGSTTLTMHLPQRALNTRGNGKPR